MTGVSFRAATGTGAITGNLPETTSTQLFIGFSGSFVADGIYQQIFFTPVIIPNVPSIDLSDLLTIVVNS